MMLLHFNWNGCTFRRGCFFQGVAGNLMASRHHGAVMAFASGAGDYVRRTADHQDHFIPAIDLDRERDVSRRSGSKTNESPPS